MTMARPSEAHVRHGWQLLGHESGWTEMFAKSQYFKPGRENTEHNREHNAFPKHRYANDENVVVAFALRYHEDHTVMYGINSRHEIHRNKHGYPRSARDDEIRTSQNLLLDYDFQSKRPTSAQRSEFVTYLTTEFRNYFFDLGFEAPIVVDSGRGANVLVCYPPIMVHDVPDIVARKRRFASEVFSDHRSVFGRLEVAQDNVQDLGRYLRVIGTAKPEVGIASRVYGSSRVEDEALRDYLLALEIPSSHPSRSACTISRRGGLEIRIGDGIPPPIKDNLKRNKELDALWNGEGKPRGSDMSASGYDFSLALWFLEEGEYSTNQIATALAHRPKGAIQQSGKNPTSYMQHTIQNALIAFANSLRK